MTIALSVKAFYSWVMTAGVAVGGSAGSCLLIARQTL